MCELDFTNFYTRSEIEVKGDFIKIPDFFNDITRRIKQYKRQTFVISFFALSSPKSTP